VARMDWQRASARAERHSAHRDSRLERADTLNWRHRPAEGADTRELCVICDRPEKPDGYRTHRLSSGSLVHDVCVTGKAKERFL